MRTASREAATIFVAQLDVRPAAVETRAARAGAAGDGDTYVAPECVATMDVARSSSLDPVVSKVNTLYKHRTRRGIKLASGPLHRIRT